MIKSYAVVGLNLENDKWQTFIVVKVTNKQQAQTLLDLYLKSHVKGAMFITCRVLSITDKNFDAFAQFDSCRAFVSTAAAKELETQETKRQMLIGAP